MMRPKILLPVACALLFLAPALPTSRAQAGPDDGNSAGASAGEALELSLEVLFDEESHFGPAASDLAISADGTRAAFLWRPYPERRHGPDLYVAELESGAVERVTSVSVLAPFQAGSRRVGEDRIARAAKRAAKGGKNGSNGSNGGDGAGKASGDEGGAGASAEQGALTGTWDELAARAKGDADGDDREDRKGMDVVDEDDAEDEDAPRYGGVDSLVWAPGANELLFTSGGDVYRYSPTGDAPRIARLTKTREKERNVQYLPDGSGYTTLSNDALIAVRFGEHFVHQLDPPLPGGMSMRRYALSPDGKWLVFIASNAARDEGPRRTVDIATYRDRFMKVRTVPRTVSDDPISKSKSAVFLFGLPEADLENGRLIQVFDRESTGPRDVLQLPDWAPDSSRVTFAAFDQGSGQVLVLESTVPGPSDGVAAQEPDREGQGGGAPKEAPYGDRRRGKGPDFETIDATVVQRFLHTGGPNTPRMIDPRYLADSRRIVLLTEHTGYRQLHVLDPLYEALEPLTQGRFEVYPRDLSRDRSSVLVEATKEDPACLDAYRVDLATGEMRRLSPLRGAYADAVVSADGRWLLANYTASATPRELVLVDAAEGTQRPLTNSHSERAVRITDAEPTWFDYDNRHGQRIHGFLFEPERASREEKRPLLLYVYGGPLGTRKQVHEGNFSSAAYLFARYMTDHHGWVTATIDPRGMSGYGAKFEKANFEQVGRPQVEDLVDGVAHLVAEYGVDPARVALHGWSFGGFQTQMCLYTEPEVFRTGIAGAGPTEWENYNSWYSTGTIGESREGSTDLAKYSLLPLAKNLERKLLLVHGMEDSNVLYQDTVRVYAGLLDAGKETLVELFLDPTGGHGLGGHVKRLGQYRKYEEFLLRTNVAPDAAAPAGSDPAERPASGVARGRR